MRPYFAICNVAIGMTAMMNMNSEMIMQIMLDMAKESGANLNQEIVKFLYTSSGFPFPEGTYMISIDTKRKMIKIERSVN